MYRMCRWMLIIAVLAAVAIVVMVAVRLGGVIFVGAAVLLIARFRKRGSRALSAFGTARWAKAAELKKAGMLDAKTGLIVGRVMDDGKLPFPKALGELFDPTTDHQEACQQFLDSIKLDHKPEINPALVKLTSAVHTMICAPTGVGKNVSCAAPFLFTSPESAVVVDFKGENAKLTSEHRRRVFGHRIVLLDPYKIVTETPDTLNVLDSIDKDSPVAIDDCRDLAEALVIRTGQEKDPHFVDSAEGFISAKTALVVQYGEPNDRSLQTVRTLLTNPKKMDMAIKLMRSSDAWEGMLARMGDDLTHSKDRELGSTLTTTNRFLRFLDTLAVKASTSTSSFDPAELLTGKMTVYLILPPKHARAQSPLLRLWIVALLRAVVRGGLQEKAKVHFVLDEAASLGHMAVIDDAVDKYRGYGVRLQFYFQSLGQIKKCFPDGQEQTLLSNVSSVFFGVNDYATAEYLSNRLGAETIVIASGGTSDGTSRQRSEQGKGSTTSSSNRNDNWQQHGRKLLMPDEVMALPPRMAITLTPGVPPICTTLVRYYEEPNLGQGPGAREQFKAKADIVIGSVLLFVAAMFFAIGLAIHGPIRPAAKQPPAAYGQRYHHR